MARYPNCPSCGCDMQLLSGGWRCPWTTSDRGEAADVTVPGPLGRLSSTTARGVVCGWPGGSRDVSGLARRHSGG